MLRTDVSDVTIEAIARRVEKGECILFLGAGVHGPPPDGSPYEYPDEQRPPLGGELALRLAERCNFADASPQASPTALQRISLYYEIKTSRQALVREITDAVDYQTRPSPALRALARLNFPLVITTNYDRLFERALAEANKQQYVGLYETEQNPTAECPHDPTPERPFLFKIHGDISRPESIVITDEDYIQFILRMSHEGPYHPIPMMLKYHLTRWPTLFVGYSLLDYNLRLLFKTLRWKVDRARLPDTYAVDIAPDPLIVEVLDLQQKYVKFIAQDVWQFVPRLHRMVTGEEI
jgi:hypothetical protein